MCVGLPVKMSISTAHTNLIDGFPMQRVCFRVLDGSEDDDAMTSCVLLRLTIQCDTFVK